MLVLSGCYGTVGELPSLTGDTGGGSDMIAAGGGDISGTTGGGDAAGGNTATGGSGMQISTPACDPTSVPTTITIEDIAAQFETSVHPKMVSASATNCTDCHTPDSHRQFIVTASGQETFHLARAANLFRNQPGSLLARMTSAESSRMPLAQPAWNQDDLDAVARIACMVQTYEARGGIPADELFPAQLLEAYSGPANTDYDNTFINYVQLKAKVNAVFADNWVRTGVDNFDKNIGLFGGVNFRTNFVEARAATSEFLIGLDSLAPDICDKAATAASGPFAGMTLTTPLLDVPASSTQTFEAETATVTPSGVGQAGTNPGNFLCWTNCLMTANVTLPSPGTYQIVMRAKPTLAGGIGPDLIAQLGSAAAPAVTFTNAAAYEDRTATVTVTTSGVTSLSLSFPNDAVIGTEDRNIFIDSFKVIGPIGTSTGTTRETAAKTAVSTLYSRMLYRAATTAEQTDAYALLKDLAPLGTTTTAWAGLCEGLVAHPDFLFTLPPHFDAMGVTAAEKDKLRLVALSQRMVGRPPTAAEFTKLTSSGFMSVLNDYLTSTDFRTYYMNRMQLRLESQGTIDSDEPARLWTYLAVTGTPFEQLLTGDYSIDSQFAKQTRTAEHGHTGLLTMKGYVSNKPGLPHYNYPARVMSGFMGTIFEVPPEVFDQRGTATAASTVDPTSICFQCHQMLTPLAHQRLRWADDGTYRTADENGVAIDDTDRNLVPTYPYKGQGMESFSVKAVKKEAFIRRMINAQFKLVVGRDLRHLEDERVLYKQLWDDAATNHGNIQSLIRAIAMSSSFQRTP